MATCTHSSRSCLLPFYTIPIFPLLNRMIFHLLVILMVRYGRGTSRCIGHVDPRGKLNDRSRQLSHSSCEVFCARAEGGSCSDPLPFYTPELDRFCW